MEKKFYIKPAILKTVELGDEICDEMGESTWSATTGGSKVPIVNGNPSNGWVTAKGIWSFDDEEEYESEYDEDDIFN